MIEATLTTEQISAASRLRRICVHLCSSVSPEKLQDLTVRADALKEGISHHIDLWREAVAADKLRPKLGPMGKAELAFLPAAL